MKMDGLKNWFYGWRASRRLVCAVKMRKRIERDVTASIRLELDNGSVLVLSGGVPVGSLRVEPDDYARIETWRKAFVERELKKHED